MTDKDVSTGFPKWKYPADGTAGKIVSSAEEEATLGEGWSDTPIAPSRNDQVLTVIAHLVARPDKIEETKKFLLALVERTRREKDCLDYNLHQDNDRPTEFTFYENWVNRAAWDIHMTRPYIKDLARTSKDILAVNPHIRLTTKLS
jgi:quinol monooxygenase YgiN